jgi:MFS family permease
MTAQRTSFYGRYTFRLHLRAASLEAVAGGAMLLNEFVARKALGASAFAITMMLMLPTVAQLLNLYWTGMTGSNPRRAFLWVGLPSRLALVAIGLSHSSAGFIALAALASTASTVVIPAQNALFQANYDARERGRLFSRVSAASAAVTVLVSTGIGWLYDRDESLYRWVYPLTGLVAALGSYGWYRIEWRRRVAPDLVPAGPAAVASVPRPAPAVAARVAHGFLEPFRGALRLFHEDRDFLRFEAAFMTYGMAFMMLQPVLPIFLVDELKVDYSSASLLKGLLFYAVTILCLPLAGRLQDRHGSPWVASRAFLLPGGFALLLLLVPATAAGEAPSALALGTVYAAYAVYGAAMALVNVTWTLGPLTMAGERSAHRYMGAHVSLVGIRGLIGYPLGLLLMRLASSRATFAAALALEVAAAAIMLSLHRKRSARGEGGAAPAGPTSARG